MINKHNLSIIVLISLGIVVTMVLLWQALSAKDGQKDVNPYADLVRPVVYPESPQEGNDGAKLQIFEFADFACPTCAQMQPIVEQIFAKYGDRLAHVWKDFPIHPDISEKAAAAGRCAAQQGKFWPFHDRLFKEQANISKLSFVDEAKKLGLNQAKFSACLADKTMLDYVERDFLEGQALGVGETPAFIVGNQAFSGVVSFEDFEKIVLEELTKL